MMKKMIASLGLSLVALVSSYAATPVEYTVRMSEPHTHYFEVEMTVSDLKADELNFTMPVWAPGSYLVREFSKSVEDFAAQNSGGKPLNWERTDKNTWTVQTRGAKKVTVMYRVYAYEMSVRTSYLNTSHGYFNGTSIFMYVEDHKDLPAIVKIEPFEGWNMVSTGLKQLRGQKWTYTAPDYDVLVDAPFEVGTHEDWEFSAAGLPHRVAMYGWGNYDDKDQVMQDMAKVVEACTEVFGENPNDDYLFIVQNLTNGSGGLEHLNSTTLQVNRWTYGPGRYNSFLGLAAHEYFHLWNVKRIRPEALGPFDYQNENYTHHLWVMEGFTSYYADILLMRAGFKSEDDFLNSYFGTVSRVESQPGTRVQSMAMASFEAWIKAYRPNENSYNTTISYYSKGEVLAGLLDLIILHETKGEKNLDDAMQILYNDIYKKKGRGFTTEELIAVFEEVAGIEMDDWFDRYVFGVEVPDYETIYGYAGLNVSNSMEGNNEPHFGARMNGSMEVSGVARGTTAYDGGINVEDEIIAINGFRVSSDSQLERHLSEAGVGGTIEVTVSRDNVLQTLTMEVKNDPGVRMNIEFQPNMSALQTTVLKQWLRKMGE